MSNYYLWILINVFFFNFNEIYCKNRQLEEINKINLSIKTREKDNYFGGPDGNPPPDDNPQPDDQKPPEDDSDDIFLKVDKLLAKEKELNLVYDSEYNKFLNYEIQLQNIKTYLYFLIGVVVVLFLILFIYSIFECLKCKTKAKMEIFKKEDRKMKPNISGLFSSSSSTFDSNMKSSLDKLPDKLSISSNFNILIHSQKMEKENNEDQKDYNINEGIDDGDVAPVEYYIENNNSNIKEELKTLTNDENIYVESRTDQLLYKPYSEDEINK